MKIVCKDTKEVCSNYKEYLNSDHWNNFKNLYYYKLGKQCRICGKKYNLNLHHLDYTRLGKEKESDVILLCGYCHNLTHEMYGLNTRDKLKNKQATKPKKAKKPQRTKVKKL